MFEFTICDDGTITEIITNPKNQQVEESVRNSMGAEDTLEDLRRQGFVIEIQLVPNGRRIFGQSRMIEFQGTICHINAEMQRIGWTTQQGREHLIKTYGKRSRSQLTDDQLLEFLNHLESIGGTNGK